MQHASESDPPSPDAATAASSDSKPASLLSASFSAVHAALSTEHGERPGQAARGNATRQRCRNAGGSCRTFGTFTTAQTLIFAALLATSRSMPSARADPTNLSAGRAKSSACALRGGPARPYPCSVTASGGHGLSA